MYKKLYKKTITVLVAMNLFYSGMYAQQGEQPVYKNAAFTVFGNRVEQGGKYKATAHSAHEIVSDYKSPANEFVSAHISFKCSINGKDNEMKPGVDHHFVCSGFKNETPAIVFGEQLKPTAEADKAGYLKPGTELTIRIDMRKVLADFSKQGYFVTVNSDKIYKEDFKGLYVAGATAPMMWDFDNLHNRPVLQLKDEDGDGIFTTTLQLNQPADEKQTESTWKQTRDLSAYPIYESPQVLANAIYNMSLEEMVNAVEPDSTFRTGKEWAGVWTRDISYSIILSMAYLQPRVAIYSLLRKVNKRKRIIQDTGTGGAYPASTDRIIWATAAWEVYKATGDKDWLQLAFEIVQNSINDDLQNAYDTQTGLVRGESSFLDWREQTYPRWMQPADIYNSYNLGTNAAHYNGNIVLAEMARELGNMNVYTKHMQVAQSLRQAINKNMWNAGNGYYGQFIYGRNSKLLSPKSETLGEALTILFGIADPARAKQLISRIPVGDFGAPCVYPQIPGIPPYHNNAVWPFVQSYYALAAAKKGNEQAVLASFGSIYRAAALFATNKENYVASNGDFAGTQINSSNMLWSLSGNIALVHKILFGIQFESHSLQFHPFVPQALEGKRSLRNFSYRAATLDIEMDGWGNQIARFLLDGKEVREAEIPATLTGTHRIQIQLKSGIAAMPVRHLPGLVTPDVPRVSLENQLLQWNKVPDAVSYQVLANGILFRSLTQTSIQLPETTRATEYQVLALDAKGTPGFASEPILVAKNLMQLFATDVAAKADYSYKGHSGKGFAEISASVNKELTIPVLVPVSGWYRVDYRYANGNGPTNTSNKCAIRSLYVNQKKSGTIVFPQRGEGEWSNWGFSNPERIYLKAGKNQITLRYEDWNTNMNETVNQAMIDYMRLIPWPESVTR